MIVCIVFTSILLTSEPAPEAPRTVGIAGPLGATGLGLAGITGIGRLAADSPGSRAGRRRHDEQGLDELGGERALRELVAGFLAARGGRGVPEEVRASDIQDLWVSRRPGTGREARITALYTTGRSSDCRQFCLELRDGRWAVTQLLDPEAGSDDEGDACESLLAAALLSPPSPASPADRASPASPADRASPARRRAPPPLTELLGDEAEAGEVPGAFPPADAEEDARAGDSLAESVRFGLDVAEVAATPRALFASFAGCAIDGSSGLMPEESFAALVRTYGGRSPAALGGEDVARALFEELAVSLEDIAGVVRLARGVPYDVFCAEFCPETAPDAVARLGRRREALVEDLRAAVRRAAGAKAGAYALKPLSWREARRAVVCAAIGEGFLAEAPFASAMQALLGTPPAPQADPIALKALWCHLARGGAAGATETPRRRTIAAADLCDLLGDAGDAEPLDGDAGDASPPTSPPAGGVLARRSLAVEPLELDVDEAAAGDAAEAAGDGRDHDSDALLEAMRFGAQAVAACQTTPRADSALRAALAWAVSEKEISVCHGDFLRLAAELGGGSLVRGEERSTDAAARCLFEELAVGGAVPYDLLAAEVWPELAPEAAARAVALRDGLQKDLRAAAASLPEDGVRALVGREPVDEAGFGIVARGVLRPGPEPSPLAAKALWCSLECGRSASVMIIYHY